MDNETLVYFVTKGPLLVIDHGGDEFYQLKAQVSYDGGGSVESAWFAFDTEDNAAKYKHMVNNRIEPTILGADE